MRSSAVPAGTRARRYWPRASVRVRMEVPTTTSSTPRSGRPVSESNTRPWIAPVFWAWAPSAPAPGTASTPNERASARNSPGKDPMPTSGPGVSALPTPPLPASSWHPGDQRRDRQRLDNDEQNRSAIDRRGRDLLRRHAAQVEQRESERRREEGGLHVHRHHDPQPGEIDPEHGRSRPDERHDDERDLEEIDEEAQHEDQQVHHDQEPDRPSGQP